MALINNNSADDFSIKLSPCICIATLTVAALAISGEDLSRYLFVHDKSYAKLICNLLRLAPTMFYIF